MGLYDFKSDTLHAKFFEWMWNVKPKEKYKTACPYTWQYVGSIIILPIIILVKLYKWIAKPISNMIESYNERYAEKLVKQMIEDLKNARTDKDYYSIVNTKCWSKWNYQIFELDGDFTYTKRDEIYNKYYDYSREMNKKKKESKLKLQTQMDNFKYGKVGTYLSYILGASVIVGIGFFFYWFVHLFTMAAFINFLLYAGITIGVVLVIAAVVVAVMYLYEQIPCDNKVKDFFNGIVFWKYIGQFFVMIWNGLKIMVDMIVNIYKKQCPTIHWD